MSSTWRDMADHGQSRAAARRLRKRIGAPRASLALPAVVMGVLGGAFVVWFMTGGPVNGSAGFANASTIRPAVQSPQIATAPAMVDPESTEPAQTPPLSVLIAAMTTAPEAAPAAQGAAQDLSMLPLALQPTRQITTPAPMTAVVGEPQQISAPRIIPAAPTSPPAPPAPPERRASAVPASAPAPAATPSAQPTQAGASPAPKATPGQMAAAQPQAAEAERPPRPAFSVVLASVETQGEAHARLLQLKQKYASILGGRRINYHRTKQDGVYVWHVRSAGLTEADAEAICEKIEKAGGECSAIDQ